MKNTWKRIIALILAMAMCLSLLSANVWAAEEPADGSSSPQDSQIETLAEESSEEDAAEQEDSVEEPQEERSAEEEDSTSEPDAAADAPDDSEESDPVQQDDTKEEQENVVPEETIKEEADSAEEETPALPEPDIDSSEDSTEGEPDQNEENAEQPEAEDSLAQAFDENDVLDGGDAALTRGEWMHNLAVMFELKVDEDGAPDDYFSDLDSSYQYYSDVLACVTYGVIDVEEGEAIGVNNTLTRDYAAHTLNYLIGYQLDSGSYTFSDSSDCSDADSAQIAVNQGWMNLVNGRFMPNQPVTTDEISRMVSDARSARDNDTISSEHENTFEFAPDVIVVPDGTEVSIDDSNTITIQNCPVSIKKNDRFAVYLNGIAVVYSATSVELSETKTIITTKEVDDTEVYTACNAEGVIEPDITLIQPADGVKLTFVDESTDTTYLSAQSALEAMGSHVLKKASITTEYKYKVNDSISVKVKAKLKDPKIEYSIMDGNTVASAKMTSDIEVSFSVEGDLAALNKPVGTDKIYLFQWGVPGIGGFDVFVDVELSGKVSGVKKGKLTTGFTCDNNNNFRVIYQYQPSGLSINAEATAGLGIQAQLGLTQMPLVKAYVYGKAGAKAQLSEKNYTDSNLPHVCSEFKAYLYASYGAKGQISTLNKKNSFSVNIEKTVLNEKNSPIRILKHYEDGKLVNSCSRGNAIGYLTSGNSKYAGSGWSLGSGFGFDEAGNSVNVYDYTLDDDGNAVITKFNGSSAVVSIPDTIDGYKVVKIGNKAFQKNTRLRVVIVPDGVGSIGGSVFANCINLSSVDLPDSVTEIGNYAFANTALTSLTLPRNLTTIGARILSETTGVKEITIPKSVTETRYNIAGYVGSFDNSYLEKVVFEEGITKVPTQVCDECKYLKEAIIPNSVTEIGNYAFAGTALTSLTLPKNLTTMGARILSGTTGVKEITIPKSVTETRYNIAGYVGSFDNSYLEKVVFEEGITKVPTQICDECKYLKETVIPNSVTEIGNYAFAGTALSGVDLPDSVTEIGSYAFSNTGLTSLTLPKNLTTMGARILSGTTGVKEITIPKSVTVTRENVAGYIGSFDNSYLEKIVFEEGITKVPTQVCDECKYLKEAIIPNSVTEIGNYAFAGTALTSLTLPKNLTTMGARILSGTTGVKEITIPKSVTETRYNIAGYVGSFDNSCLEEVVFEEGITKVPSQACEGCEYLKEVVIPNSVTEIGGYAFERCKSLNRITLPDTITEIGNRAFANAGLVSPVLPQNLLKINEGVFQNCTSLTSIVLPNSSTSLGTYLFDGCTGLKNVTINNTQQTITSCMFHNCIALEEITLPDTVTTIQDHAFKGCTALKTIHWSKSLNQINSYAFENCEALEEIEVPATVTSVGEGAFYNCDGLKKATIPDSVSSFGKKMFYDCDVLTTVSLGTGLTTLPESAFEHCDVLESLVVPFRVATIGKNLLKDSVKFKEITIPRATTSIDASAFSYPGKLTIYGVGGTYAETFANANNITFVDKQVNATKVELSQTQITMNKGATQKLVMTVMPNNFTDLVTWKSTKPEIATIADDGTVKAVGIGETTIKLTVGSVSATCKVTVVQPVTSISLNRNSVSLEALSTFQLTATAYPDNANNREVEWSSSEPDTASVNSTGLVTAHKKGTATITALAKDGSGVKRTCTVTVTNTAHIAATVEELESEHNYPDKCSDFWVYSLEGANALDVTFDTRTDIEEDFDFLYLYDGEGNEVGTYTGTSLAGQTVTVPGSIVRIKLVSDNSGNTWGFKVSSVTKSENQQPGHTHTWDEGSVTTPATCKNKGVKTYNCTGCDETKTEDIDKNPDNHVGGTEIRGRKAATCGTAGYTGDTYCLGCGVKVASGSVISATGKHNWDKGMVTKEPTTAEEGERTYTCGVCGGTKTEVIEKLPEPEKEENVISGKDTFTKTVNVKKNQTFMLGASANGAALSYKSNNKKVTVAKNGKVTIKKGFVGTAIITITAAETDEYLSTSKDVTVFVNPSVTQLSSVKWDKKKKTANVAWKKNTTGKGYEVQYATDKKFNKSLKTINIKKNKTVKTVVKKLAKGTYYFRIRTVNGNNYSAWSKVKTLKIAK